MIYPHRIDGCFFEASMNNADVHASFFEHLAVLENTRTTATAFWSLPFINLKRGAV